LPSKADIPDALSVPLALGLVMALLLSAVAALPDSKESVCAQLEEAPATSKPMLKSKVEPKVNIKGKPRFELEPKPVLEVLSKLVPMPMPEPSQADNLRRTNPLTQDTSNGTINS
jgi:hypothetical protein